MSFREACLEAVQKAREHNVVFYVYSAPTHWQITPSSAGYFQEGTHWLFRAFPGGRKELSIAGNHLLDQEDNAKAVLEL